MSLHENIARLTGQLNFDVNTAGLSKFHQMLKRTQQMMTQVNKEAEALQRKLNLKLGIKAPADKAKLEGSVRHALDRELKLERAAQQARSETFRAELLNQKLVSAGTRENTALQTQALKGKIQQAVLDAKSAKASQEQLKAQGIAVRNEQSIVAAKARQIRLDSMLQAQRAKTVTAQQRALQSLTATQKLELSLQETRTRSQRAATRFIEQQAEKKVRSERATEKHQQQQQRFQWAQARQQVWEANRNKPEPSTGFMGLGAGGLALGGATAGIALIVGAINALGDRIGATQQRVSESQQFANILEQAAGKNPKNKDFARNEFLRINAKYGTAADIDSAKAYRTFLLAEMARGKSISQATNTYETRQSAFRGAGMTREEQVRANLQLQQIASKSQGDREDLNTFSEAAPLLIEPIRRAWAERNKHKLNANLEKDFRASTTKGNLKAVDFENGIKLFVKENAAAIERQSGSIDANATRLTNQKFIQQQGLDQSPELINSINDRIKSEMELNDALKPLKETAIATDTALNKLAASFLRWTIGKDQNPNDAANKVELLNPDKGAIDPQALSGIEVDSSKAKQQDPVDRFYNWLTDAPDYSKGPANELKAKPFDPLTSFFKELDLSKLGKLPEISDGMFHAIERSSFNVESAMAGAMHKAPSMYRSAPEVSVPEWKTEPANTTVTNNVTNSPVINVNVSTETNASPQEIAEVAGAVFEEKLQRAFAKTNVSLVETK